MVGPRRAGRRRRLTLLALVLISLTVITLDYRHSGPVGKVRDAAATIFSPVRSAADTVFRPVGNAWNSAFHYDKVKKENQKLRRQLAEARGKQYQNQIDAQQYHQLLQANRIPYIGDLPRTIAQVTSGPLTSFSKTIEINKGAGDGVKVDMPVITPEGLVGKVSRVEGGHAIVQLITSPDTAVDVNVIPNGDPTVPGTVGIARGTGQAKLLRIDNGGVLPTTPIHKGDLVSTSGIDTSIYPQGIPVGKIISFNDSSDGTQKMVDIQPTADLSNLSYVTVVLWQPAPS
ncbi:MAG: rod shape-determining protein MreC [Acidimicrobiales bacterium]